MASANLSAFATTAEFNAFRVEMHAALDALNNATETMWVLFVAVVIFFMQCGFAMLEAGTVREQSVRDILLKNLLDASVGSLSWFAIGFAFSTDGGGAFLGMPSFHANSSVVTPFDALELAHGADMGKYLMSFMYAVTCATIVSGAIAERTQQRAYIVSSSFVVALVYPATSHWVWSDCGWLSPRNPDALLGGVFDFAGGGAVHLTSGVFALVAAKIIGPRNGRFDRWRRPVQMPGHSSALMVLGTLLLLIGWLGFNVGSVPRITAAGAPLMAAQTAVRTTLAGSAGSLAALTAGRCMQNNVWSLEHACNGLLAGLVSITAGAPAISNWASLLVGAVGA